MFHNMPVFPNPKPNPFIPTNNFVRARGRFNSVIGLERHAILKKSSAGPFDYDSDFDDDTFREVQKRQKLNFESSAICKKAGSYNLKLFDRYIDVTPFKEDSPLYPICREWIKNHPDSKKRSSEKGYREKESTRKKEGDAVEENVINELPAPKPLPCDMHGNPINIRIPDTLTVEDAQGSIWDFFDGNASQESLPSPAILFQAHLDRWNDVKKRWRLAKKLDDQRYKQSFDVIQEAFRETPPLSEPSS